ncbi:hypothetical protein B0T11DRAFT_76917 [Plectosphaerella cucumerina]|uniref:Uncharacterized protein n=1 Tax=Plectosphaerella cucumerina TaxID=40658 RepID=A0A8K0X3T1_9PEZI|nr:hypothetical protein B0T11DRAFT_76917 [Plectosphaerella cucumerina]
MGHARVRWVARVVRERLVWSGYTTAGGASQGSAAHTPAWSSSGAGRSRIVCRRPGWTGSRRQRAQASGCAVLARTCGTRLRPAMRPHYDDGFLCADGPHSLTGRSRVSRHVHCAGNSSSAGEGREAPEDQRSRPRGALQVTVLGVRRRV